MTAYVLVATWAVDTESLSHRWVSGCNRVAGDLGLLRSLERN